MSDTVEVIILAKDEASRTIGGVRSALGGLGSAVGTVARVGTAAFLGVGAAAVGGFGLALKSSIGMNSQLEQSTMMFTTLMGDAQLAEDHVRSLFDFAAATPFETGPIIEASKHLQIFGGDALNTMDNLTLVGDAAAAVGAPIDEVAFWVGRMYSNLQAGQPFGEAAMRLQELGIMAPGTRQAMEDLQKTGADGATVWNEFTGAAGNFTGAMVMQSQSWTGLTSTIKDNISMEMPKLQSEIQWFGQSIFTERIILHLEAISMDTVKNATATFKSMKVIGEAKEKSAGGIRVLVEEGSLKAL